MEPALIAESSREAFTKITAEVIYPHPFVIWPFLKPTALYSLLSGDLQFVNVEGCEHYGDNMSKDLEPCSDLQGVQMTDNVWIVFYK